MFHHQPWENIRRKGKKWYLWYRVRVGLALAVVLTLVREWSEMGGIYWERLISPPFLKLFAVTLLGFPIVFLLLGLLLWNRNEKWYAEEERKQN